MPNSTKALAINVTAMNEHLLNCICKTFVLSTTQAASQVGQAISLKKSGTNTHRATAGSLKAAFWRFRPGEANRLSYNGGADVTSEAHSKVQRHPAKHLVGNHRAQQFLPPPFAAANPLVRTLNLPQLLDP